MNGMHIDKIEYPPVGIDGYADGVIVREGESVEWKIAMRDGKRIIYGYEIISDNAGLEDLEFD